VLGDNPSFQDVAGEQGHARVATYCAVPVVVDDEVELVLYALRRTDRAFDVGQGDVLSLLAGQVAAAVQRIRALAQAEQRRQRAELLRDITRSLAGTLDHSAVLEHFAAALLEVTGVDRVCVLLLDEDGVYLRVALCRGAGSVAFGPVLARVLSRVPMQSSPTMTRSLAERSTITRAVGTPSGSPLGDLYDAATDAATVSLHPLVVNGQATGFVLLEQHEPGAWLAGWAHEAVEQISTVAAVALRHAELYQQLEQDGAQLRALHDVTLAIGASDDLTTTLQKITDAAARLTGAQRCRLGLRGEGETYQLAAVTGDTDQPGASYLLSSAVGGWVIRHGRSAWLPDLAAGLAEPPDALAAARRPEGSALAVPLVRRHGDTVGFLSLHDPRPGHFRRDVTALLERFAAEAVLALDNSEDAGARAALEHQLREQAQHDPLTGLANRTLLLQRLDDALAGAPECGHVGVLYLDLDRFKTVNDSLGHAGGDDLLVRVGERLSAAVRPQDLVARLGGDEFVLLAEGLASPAEAALLADRVLDALAPPVQVGGTQVFVGASIGLVTARGTRRDARQLLRDADIAMYQAKRTGRGRASVFRAPMRAQASRRLPLATELREALDAGHLEVHYQPIVRLQDAALTGFEALVRWPHRSRGMVPPDEFIPVAEETGLVVRVDDLVMRIAVGQLRRWQTRHARPDLRINVNLSAVSLHGPEVAGRVASALRTAGLDAASLTVELTETAAMRDPVVSLAVCHQLRRLGVGIAIDDFGTGYSNLGYLRRFPIDVLKIDRQFTGLLVPGGNGEPVVRAIIALATAFGLGVTAEGVETDAQAAALLAMGCPSAQGWLYGRPLAPDDVDRLLAAPPQPRAAVAHRAAAGA